MAVPALRNSLVVAALSLASCHDEPGPTVAIAVLNLEESPRRLVEVCLAKDCTKVNAVLEHGDEAIVTVKPRKDTSIELRVEERGGARVLPCDIRVHDGLTGSLQIALSEGAARVQKNKMRAR